MKKVFYFDVETTGLDCKKHGICQISYLLIEDFKILSQGSYFMNPEGKEFDQGALMVHGYSESQIKSFMKATDVFALILIELSKYKGNYERFVLAGYNVQFDIGFLRELFENNGVYFNTFFDMRAVDPLPVLYYLNYLGLLKLENYKLATVCRAFEIPHNPHDAESDINATISLIQKLNKMFQRGFANLNMYDLK